MSYSSEQCKQPISPASSAAKLLHSHDHNIIQVISTVLKHQLCALDFLIENISYNCIDLVNEIISCSGRVIFTGMGKSGHVARKLAATFASTGIPALFLHPTEALHGDLGVICSDDLVLSFSKSGMSEEFSLLFPIMRKLGNKIALFSCHQTELADRVNFHILIPCQQEAPPLSVAPTTSSLLMLALGDALALTVSSLRKFTQFDFAQKHPGGTLGKTLLLTVEALMQSEQLPLLYVDTPFQELLVTITRRKLGVGIVVDAQGRLLGVVTDGDLRRACSKGVSVFNCCAGDIMTAQPKTAYAVQRAAIALKCMRHFTITSLVVVNDDEHVIGLLHIHDILRAGIQE